MSSYDPRQLRVVLEDLQHYIGIWSSVATDTLNEADYSQAITREHVDRAIHETSMVKSQAEKDVAQINSKQPEYDSLSAKSEEAVATAQDTLNKAREAYQQAQQTLMHWQSELEKALAWLEQAKIRLEKAEQEYKIAKSDAERAKNRVEQAERNYRRCQNDNNRRDCRSEARDLERAQDNLHVATYQLEIARVELNAAIADYDRAVARVNCCRQAVGYASEAMTHAPHSQTSAVNGERMAALSVEYSTEVQKLFKLAKKKSGEEVETATQMSMTVREATETTDQAQRHLAQADSLEESAQGYYYRADIELVSRINSLIELNQPIPSPTTTSSPTIAGEKNEQKSNVMGNKRINTMPHNIHIEGGHKDELQSTIKNTSTQNPFQAIRIRITDDNGRKTGSYANAELRVTKQYNNDTRQYDLLDDIRVRLNDILVPESQRGNGIGSIMLEQVEELARDSGAREIYGTLEGEESRQFFTNHGYQFRGENNNELYKSLQ